MSVSPVSDQGTLQPLANHVGNITSSESMSKLIDNVSPMSQATIQPLASQLGNIPPLDLTSRHESDPEACHFCKQTYSTDGEPRVFLPCGHSFGLHCLFRWFCHGLSVYIYRELPFAHTKCPHDCIDLRHRCGHLVIPYDSVPHSLHTDVSAIAIPSAYEFCRKGRGRKLSREIKWLQILEKALCREKRRLIPNVLFVRRPLYSIIRKRRVEAELDLGREHRIWWLREWGKRMRIRVNLLDSVFNTHHGWESLLRQDTLRDLEVLGLEQL